MFISKRKLNRKLELAKHLLDIGRNKNAYFMLRIIENEFKKFDDTNILNDEIAKFKEYSNVLKHNMLTAIKQSI